MKLSFDQGIEFFDTEWGANMHLIPQHNWEINNIAMWAEVSQLEPEYIKRGKASKNRKEWEAT